MALSESSAFPLEYLKPAHGGRRKQLRNVALGENQEAVMQVEEVLRTLKALASGTVRDSMKRFGINVENAQGINAPTLKALARQIGKDHQLAQELWAAGTFEARALAALIGEPAKVTRSQMERWARALDSWALCDCCCCYLFRRTPFAWAKAVEWTHKPGEFHKRAGFALMAYLAIHDKKAADQAFADLLPILEREADDDRPFVRKAVNWALRQIGKRNARLNALAILTGEVIRKRNTPSARWIASDALRELRNPKVQARLKG
jgi:3-methyladenine DNA glycosylase AlkD